MRSRWFRRQVCTFGISAFILGAAHVHAQLTWGLGGNGGSGTWDPATTADWWNGTSNVTWSAGSDAVFAGTGGTVSSVFPGPSVNSLTFNSPGYTIQSGWINAAATTFNVVTKQAATISSTLSWTGGTNTTLVKSGAATLTVSGTNFIPNVLVNQGEYLLGANSSLFFSNVTLANTPGVLVTLGQTSPYTAVGSLSGGGASGGIVQPNATARTVSLTDYGAGNFNGTLQDNGSGKLAFTLLASTGTASFGGVNTYSGSTTINSGVFNLDQNGSILNSAVSVTQGGTLQLDNSTVAVANRISDSFDLTSQGGKINFIGNSSTSLEETAGNLKFSGSTYVTNTQPGTAASLLTFAAGTRQNHGTIDFSGTGRTKWTGMANDSFGIVAAYVTAGNEWATVGGDGRVSPLATYNTNINTAASTDHVKITGGGTTNLAASTQAATLNFQNSSGSTGTLEIGSGHSLALGDGGILTSGTSASQILDGTLTAGSTGELVVTNRNALTISSTIVDSVAGTVLTKSGAGTLTLTGANTYSGVTAINEGTLVVSSDANLGTGTAIQFNGGTLKAGGSFSSSKNLTRGTTYTSLIDTAGFNVTLSGTNDSLEKTGAGTLTLTNPSVGAVNVEQGKLVLPNSTSSGSAILFGGTLQVAGTLPSLTVENAASLDIGGPGAATLTTTQVELPPSGLQVLTVEFGLGISACDLWKATTLLGLPATNQIQFDFQNLGDAGPGTYTLMNIQSGGNTLTAADFGFSPSALAAGWNGNFNVSSTSSTTVTVNITSTPEPSSALLLAVGIVGLAGRRRRR